MARPTAELTIPEVIEAMIGQQREALFPPPLPPRPGIAERRIEVSDLAGGRLDHVSFTARSGEVVGLAGLEGSGVTDILELLFGIRRARQRQRHISGRQTACRRARPMPRGAASAWCPPIAAATA